jgi:hypothetical protein
LETNEQELRVVVEKVLSSGKIDKKSFIKIPMWFDVDEDSVTLDSKFIK